MHSYFLWVFIILNSLTSYASVELYQLELESSITIEGKAPSDFTTRFILRKGEALDLTDKAGNTIKVRLNKASSKDNDGIVTLVIEVSRETEDGSLETFGESTIATIENKKSSIVIEEAGVVTIRIFVQAAKI